MRLLISTLVVALVVACGGAAAPPNDGRTAAPGATAVTGNQPPPAGGQDVCQILTTEDVERITGKPATPDNEDSDGTECDWNIGDPNEVLPDYFLSFRNDGGDLASAKLAFPEGQDISDIGDGAYWAPGVTVLWFQRGSDIYALQFVLFGEEDGDALALARQLAQVALGRL